MDEMHTYICNKKILMDPFGNRGTETGKLLWEKVKKKNWRSDDRSLESICRVSS